MSDTITMKLPWPISANDYWHSRVIYPKNGKPIVQTYVSPEAKQFKEEIGWRCKAYGIREPYAGRMLCELTLIPQLPQDWARRQRNDPEWWEDTVRCIDVDNALKVMIDALKGIAVVDDNRFWKVSSERGVPQAEKHSIVKLTFLRRRFAEQEQVGLDLSPIVDERYVPPADGLPF